MFDHFGTGQIGTFFGSAPVEVALVCAAVVLVAATLAVPALQAKAAQGRRKARATYFDHDAADYGPTGSRFASMAPNLTSAPGTAPRIWHAIDQPIAPSFTAVKRVRRDSASRNSVSPTGPLRPASPARPMVVTSARSRAGALNRTLTPMTRPVPPHTSSMVKPPITSQVPTTLSKHQTPGTLPSALPAMPPPPPSDTIP